MKCQVKCISFTNNFHKQFNLPLSNMSHNMDTKIKLNKHINHISYIFWNIFCSEGILYIYWKTCTWVCLSLVALYFKKIFETAACARAGCGRRRMRNSTVAFWSSSWGDVSTKGGRLAAGKHRPKKHPQMMVENVEKYVYKIRTLNKNRYLLVQISNIR